MPATEQGGSRVRRGVALTVDGDRPGALAFRLLLSCLRMGTVVGFVAFGLLFLWLLWLRYEGLRLRDELHAIKDRIGDRLGEARV